MVTKRKVTIDFKDDEGEKLSSVEFTVRDGRSDFENWKDEDANRKDATLEEYVEALKGSKGSSVSDVETTIEELGDIPSGEISV